MNSLLIYSISLILILTFSFSIIYLRKHINVKLVISFLVGVTMVGLCASAVIEGIKISNRLRIEDIPNEIVSTAINSNDSLINDTLVYHYLLEIRAKHPRVILAQCKLESNNYKSSLFISNRNLVGMKVSAQRTSFNSGGRSGYQRYDSWYQCLNDYVLWGMTHNYDKMSQSEYIAYLNKIYAEDNSYAQKLNKIISNINFSQLEK